MAEPTLTTPPADDTEEAEVETTPTQTPPPAAWRGWMPAMGALAALIAGIITAIAVMMWLLGPIEPEDALGQIPVETKEPPASDDADEKAEEGGDDEVDMTSIVCTGPWCEVRVVHNLAGGDAVHVVVTQPLPSGAVHRYAFPLTTKVDGEKASLAVHRDGRLTVHIAGRDKPRPVWTSCLDGAKAHPGLGWEKNEGQPSCPTFFGKVALSATDFQAQQAMLGL